MEDKLKELESLHPEFNETAIRNLATELNQLGVNKDECYLFIHGHHLFEKVVVPMLTAVCKELIRNRENEIRQQSVHNAQLNAELAGYTHATEAVSNMLRKNTAWLTAPIVKQIFKR